MEIEAGFKFKLKDGREVDVLAAAEVFHDDVKECLAMDNFGITVSLNDDPDSTEMVKYADITKEEWNEIEILADSKIYGEFKAVEHDMREDRKSRDY